MTDRAEQLQMIEDCELRESRLSDWESNFIDSIGRQLAEATLDAARLAGYACVLLDTLDDMESARTLYVELGFEDIPPYYHNPIVGAHYLKADIF